MADMKIALLGVSHWHVPLYLGGLPEGSVVAVSDDNGEIAARFGEKLGAAVYQDPWAMLDERKPDFVFAFAPHVRMKSVAEGLIERGIGFSIEKPAGMDRAEVAAIADRAAQKHVFGAIPFVWRYSDTIRDLKEKYLRTGIRHMAFRFVAGPSSRYLATSRWMLEKRTAGGGCMTNLGVHFLDMALYLAGAKGMRTVGALYHREPGRDIESYASSLFALDTGASLSLETGYAYPMSEGLQRENRWTIVTEDGYHTLAENQLELRYMGEDPRTIPIHTDSDVWYPVFARETLREFAAGERPRASLEEMLVVREILDEMDRKAAEEETR